MEMHCVESASPHLSAIVTVSIQVLFLLIAGGGGNMKVGHQWLTPIILTTQETISGGIRFTASPGK
jgi:hypothetical protein